MAQKFNSRLDAVLLGQRLRRARKSAAMTLVSLAKEVGVHHSQISRIERGEFETMNRNLQKICEFLGEHLDGDTEPSAMPTLGQRVDQLILKAPENAGALRVVVEAMEALVAGKCR